MACPSIPCVGGEGPGLLIRPDDHLAGPVVFGVMADHLKAIGRHSAVAVLRSAADRARVAPAADDQFLFLAHSASRRALAVSRAVAARLARLARSIAITTRALTARPLLSASARSQSICCGVGRIEIGFRFDDIAMGRGISVSVAGEVHPMVWFTHGRRTMPWRPAILFWYLFMSDVSYSVIEVDGVRRVPERAATPAALPAGDRAVFVIDRGFIYAGDWSLSDEGYTLANAVNLRRYESIGFEGVIADPKSNKATIVAMPYPVIVPIGSVLFRIPVPAGWGL
jgi:hypothetical protein